MTKSFPKALRASAALLALAGLAGFGLLGCGAEAPPEWPGWRGPQGLGLADGQPLPTEWSAASPNVRWKTALPGLGNSSPIAAGGRVFATTAYPVKGAPAEERVRFRAVLGLDLESGEILWNTPIFQAPAETKHRLNTLAGVTPVTDGQRIFAYFGSVLASLDTEGKILWQREVDPGYAEQSRYGASSSLVLADGAVIVVQDKEWGQTEDVGWLAAFEKDTGERRWRVTWEDTCCSYSTPLVVERGGVEEIVFAHSGRVVAYHPGTGEILWRHPYTINQMVSSPVLEGDVLAVSGGAHNVRGTYVFRLQGTGAATQPELLWERKQLAPHTSSPVLYQGRLYAVTDQGVASAFEAATGEKLFAKRLSRAQNRASLLAGDGKVYVTSSAGVVSVLAAGDRFELLAENDLGEESSNASPAVAGGCLLLRSWEHLYCIEAESIEAETVEAETTETGAPGAGA